MHLRTDGRHADRYIPEPIGRGIIKSENNMCQKIKCSDKSTIKNLFDHQSQEEKMTDDRLYTEYYLSSVAKLVTTNIQLRTARSQNSVFVYK